MPTRIKIKALSMSYITIITSILAIITVAFGASFTYLYASHKDYVLSLRLKLEEIFVSFDEFDRSLAPHLLAHHNLLTGKFDYNQFVDFTSNKENMHGAANQLNKTIILSHMYFNNLTPLMNEYKKDIDIMNKYLSSVRLTHQAISRDWDNIAREPADSTKFKELSKAISSRSSLIKDTILRDAAVIGNQKMLIPNFREHFVNSKSFVSQILKVKQ